LIPKPLGGCGRIGSIFTMTASVCVDAHIRVRLQKTLPNLPNKQQRTELSCSTELSDREDRRTILPQFSNSPILQSSNPPILHDAQGMIEVDRLPVAITECRTLHEHQTTAQLLRGANSALPAKATPEDALPNCGNRRCGNLSPEIERGYLAKEASTHAERPPLPSRA
jgi:hypothetical protein